MTIEPNGVQLGNLSKIKSKHGDEVSVAHAIQVDSQTYLHNIEFQAACGDSVHRHRVTIGAVDGPRPDHSTQEAIDKLIDSTLQEGRQFAADEASFKERLRLGLERRRSLAPPVPLTAPS